MNVKRESYFEQARETLLYTGGRLYSIRDHLRILGNENKGKHVAAIKW